MSWLVIEVDSTFKGEDVLCIHVVPDWGGEHTKVGDTCVCGPRVEVFDNGAHLIVHNVYDHLRLVGGK